MTAGAPAAVPTADFGTRFSAFMIDTIVLFSVQWVIFIVLSRQLQAVGFTSLDTCGADTTQLCEGPSTALWVLLFAFLLASTIGYHAVFEGRYGATPGKRAMGLVVVDEHDARPIGLTAGLLRSVVRQAFWLSLFFVFDVSPFDLSLPAIIFIGLPLVGMAMVAAGAVTADGRSVHDMVAKTRVVRTDQLPETPERQQIPDRDQVSVATNAVTASAVEPAESSEEPV